MLSIVILVYASHDGVAAMTRANLSRILKNTAGDFEVRVLFNGGDVFPIDADPFLTVDVVREPHESLAAAFNSEIAKCAGDIICLMHNDVEVPKDWNVPLEERAPDGFVFPKVTVPDGAGAPQHGRYPSSCCYIFSRDIYDDVGGFDEQFKGWHFEDNDFWIRGLKMGLGLIEVPDVEVLHTRGATRRQPPLPPMNAIDHAYMRENSVRYAMKHAQGRRELVLPVFPG